MGEARERNCWHVGHWLGLAVICYAVPFVLFLVFPGLVDTGWFTSIAPWFVPVFRAVSTPIAPTWLEGRTPIGQISGAMMKVEYWNSLVRRLRDHCDCFAFELGK